MCHDIDVKIKVEIKLNLRSNDKHNCMALDFVIRLFICICFSIVLKIKQKTIHIWLLSLKASHRMFDVNSIGSERKIERKMFMWIWCDKKCNVFVFSCIHSGLNTLDAYTHNCALHNLQSNRSFHFEFKCVIHFHPVAIRKCLEWQTRMNQIITNYKNWNRFNFICM